MVTYKKVSGRLNVTDCVFRRSAIPQSKQHTLGDIFTLLGTATAESACASLRWDDSSKFTNLRNHIMHGANDTVTLPVFLRVMKMLVGLRALISAIEEITDKPYAL